MFHVGQKVVCIEEFEEEGIAPEIEEICVIDGFEPDPKKLYLVLQGYPPDDSYSEECFIPLSDWQEAEEAVKELKEQMQVEHVMDIYHKVQNGEANWLDD